SRFLDLFGCGLARAVARARLDPNEGRFLTRLTLLQASRELETVGRNHPVIVVGSSHKGGGILHYEFGSVQGGVLVNIRECNYMYFCIYIPSWCQSSPYSPPPRKFATA